MFHQLELATLAENLGSVLKTVYKSSSSGPESLFQLCWHWHACIIYNSHRHTCINKNLINNPPFFLSLKKGSTPA